MRVSAFLLLPVLLLSPCYLQAESVLRRLGLALPGILFLYNDSPVDQLSSVRPGGFTVEDAARSLRQHWQVENREQLLERLAWLAHDGSSRDFRYLRSLVDRYGAAIAPSRNAPDLSQLYRASDEQTQQLAEQVRRLYPSLDPFDLRRLYLMVQMRMQFELYPQHLRGWDMARVVTLARWGYDVGFLPLDEAWRFIEFAAQQVQDNFPSWSAYVENYIYGRLFEYASLPQAVLFLRDSVLLWWQLRDRGGGWQNIQLNVYEPTGLSLLLKLFESLHTFHVAVRKGDLAAVRSLLARQQQLQLPLLHPSDSPLYLPLDQPDAHRRSVLSLAVGNYEMLTVLLGSGFRYDSGDDEERPALYWAIKDASTASAQSLLARYPTRKDRAGRGPLHWAAVEGRAGILALLLRAGFSADEPDAQGDTPLHLAARFAQVPVNQLLWEAATAAWGQRNLQGETLLHLALLNRSDSNLAPLLLQRYGQRLALDATDVRGRTALMLAAEQGSADAALLLLNRGANVDLLDAGGWTVLHYAAAAGSIEVARLVLQYHRGTINRRANDGVTPLMLACRLPDGQLAALLLQSGADPLVVDGQQQQALHYAASASPSTVQLLLEAGAAMDSRDAQGWSVLEHAVSAAQPEVVSYLLDSEILTGAAPSLKPLLLAVERGDYPMLRLLLDRGLPVEVEGDKTALLAAAALRADNYRILWALGEAGANWKRTDAEGNSPLHLASRWGSAEMVGYLLRRGSSPSQVNKNGETPLHLAVQDLSAGAEKVRLLLEGSNLEALNGEGVSPLAQAALAGNFAAVRELLNAGAQAGSAASSWPPLVAAARAGSPEILNLLLARNVDINATSRAEQLTALHYAVASRYDIFWTVPQRSQLVQRLLTAGVLLNRADSRGDTPLFWAALAGDARLTLLLLEAGANPYWGNRLGLTALQYALESSWENSYLLLGRGDIAAVKRSDEAGLLPLERTAQLGDRQTLQLLLALGAEMNAVGEMGYRPLFFALHAARPDNLLTLLRAGSDPRQVSKQGEGLLRYALRTAAPAANVLALLPALPPTEVLDQEGNTALHLAIAGQRSELVEGLLAAGNPANAANRQGDTPLHLAVQHHELQAAAALLRAGANPYITNKEKLSAAQLAVEQGDVKLLELFEQAAASPPYQKPLLGSSIKP